jgi:protein SCO1/2
MPLLCLRMVAIGALFVVAGCSPAPKQDTSPAPKQETSSVPARYDLKGKIVSVDKSAKQLTVDHEAIPGFMGAMTMGYPVKDERALDGLAPGNQITAKVVSGNGSYWLEEIAVVR